MKFNSYLRIIYIVVAAFSLTGCLKEHNGFSNTVQNEQPANVVELLRINQRLASPTAATAVPFAANPVEENILLGYVRFGSLTLPTSPVKIKLKLNNAALPATLTPLPTTAYTFITPLDNITIEPGKRMAEIRIVIKKNLLTSTVNYGLRFEIEDTGGDGNLPHSLARVYMVSVKVP